MDFEYDTYTDKSIYIIAKSAEGLRSLRGFSVLGDRVIAMRAVLLGLAAGFFGERSLAEIVGEFPAETALASDPPEGIFGESTKNLFRL